jgi:hypothetical protein
MAPAPALVVFLRGPGETAAERLVDGACRAAALDSLEAAAGSFDPRILCTDDSSLAGAGDLPAGTVIDTDEGPFHFGRRLTETVRRTGATAAACMGGGSLPFFGREEFAGVAARLAAGEAVTNNFFSADLVAFPATDDALAAVEEAERDNPLPRLLAARGVTVETLRRTLATQSDIDTPSDVAVLRLAAAGGPAGGALRLRGAENGLGPRLSTYLRKLDVDVSRFRAVLPVLTDTAKQLAVAGRVGSHAWAYLERETACRVRVFAEERGMEADGRAERGEARSLLGYHLQAVGPERLFAELATLGDALVLDSRVVFAHRGLAPPRGERFLSDLGTWREIGDPFLREFTRAAADAPVPVLLGGHSLVSGGLMALNECAWALRDAEAGQAQSS